MCNMFFFFLIPSFHLLLQRYKLKSYFYIRRIETLSMHYQTLNCPLMSWIFWKRPFILPFLFFSSILLHYLTVPFTFMSKYLENCILISEFISITLASHLSLAILRVLSVTHLSISFLLVTGIVFAHLYMISGFIPQFFQFMFTLT